MSDLKQLELPFGSAPTPFEFSVQHPEADAKERPAPGKGTPRRVRLESGELAYRLVRARRRSIGISIESGQLEARAPRYTPIAEVEAFIREKERWIARRLAECTMRPHPMRWQDGASLPVLGRTVCLRAGVGAGVGLVGDCLILPADNIERWPEQALEWLRSRALALFQERLAHFAAALGVPLPSLGLSKARTRWGSCQAKGRGGARVLLNWRLYHLPPRLIDYVVVHELAHLKQLNHSPRFWAVVASAVPDYAEVRRELNRLGRSLPEL
ncbi:MAG: M48 family metallopeptidase [Betaproteobacteria bacterium]|nr:M48 family metallopeptidase [Betaproteobacteria bacterium]